MLGHLKNLFNKPSARELARRELEDARRALLDSQRNVEWYTAEVSYQTKRIARLVVASGEIRAVSGAVDCDAMFKAVTGQKRTKIVKEGGAMYRVPTEAGADK